MVVNTSILFTITCPIHGYLGYNDYKLGLFCSYWVLGSPPGPHAAIYYRIRYQNNTYNFHNCYTDYTEVKIYLRWLGGAFVIIIL